MNYQTEVAGMSCSHCIRAITRSIQQQDPDAVVQVDLALKQVRVTADLSVNELSKAIVDAGFEPGAVQTL